MEIISKTCSKCREEKPLTGFRKAAKGKYGVHNYCARCQDLVARETYLRNREKKKLQARQWALEHPEQSKEYKKKYAQEQRDANFRTR